MKLRERLQREWEAVRGVACLGLAIGGLSLAMEASSLAISLGIEKLLNHPNVESVAVLRDTGGAILAQTKGTVYWGEFEFESGDRVRLYDGPYVSDGKLFPNTLIPNLEVGGNYKLKTRGSTIVDAQRSN